MLPVGDALGQALVPALRQQEDADDADERAAGEDDVVQEVAFLVVQLNDGRRQHAEACAGQHQPQPTTPTGGLSAQRLGSVHGHASVPRDTASRGSQDKFTADPESWLKQDATPHQSLSCGMSQTAFSSVICTPLLVH